MAVFSWRQYFREQWCTVPRPKAADDNVSSKTFLVTGSNAGLGFEASVHLTKIGPKLLIATSRDQAKCEEARKAILERAAASGLKTEVYAWPLELGSFESVRSFVDRFAAEGNGTLGALIANAGVLPGDYTRTQDGWEVALQVNYLSTVLLSILLLPYLINSSSPDSFSRLVVVSSFAHYFASKLKGIDSWNNILETINQPNFGNGYDRYQASKLLLVMFVRELAARLPASTSVIACIVDPGFCSSNIIRNQSHQWIYSTFGQLFFVRSTEEGSKTLVHGAIASDHSMHGRYLSSCRVTEESDFLFTPEGKSCSTIVWDETIALLSSIDGRVSNIVEKFLNH